MQECKKVAMRQKYKYRYVEKLLWTRLAGFVRIPPPWEQVFPKSPINYDRQNDFADNRVNPNTNREVSE